VPGAVVQENLANTKRFAICAKVKAVFWWHSQLGNVPGVRGLAQIVKMTAVRIVMVRGGHMSIGQGFLDKKDR